jgi:nucleolar pre-ribosomal-associated protein 1
VLFSNICAHEETFEVLANITCNRYATTSTVLKSGLLSWIEMQLHATIYIEEGIAWTRILENILTVVDPVKLDSATKGGWRKTLVRCLIHLLNSSGESFRVI